MNYFRRGTLSALVNCTRSKPHTSSSTRLISTSMSGSLYSEAWLTGAGSTEFYTRTYTPKDSPPKAAIVFVHGFAEHIGRYTHFHPQLAAKGVSVFAFDQRGFGLTAQDTTGKKSKSSSYGKTSIKEQMSDIAWAVEHAKKTFANTPMFLMGHSMGGGEVLWFGTQGENGPHKSTLDSLSGIIATSPMILQTTPVSKVTRWVGGKLSVVLPTTLIPTPLNESDLSHDPNVGATYAKDPLVRLQGTLKGVNDMMSSGEALVKSAYSKWAKNTPVLIIHGTEDKVTSCQASKDFYEKIPATKKKLSLFEGGYHELQNEPDGVQEKLANEIITFIEEHSAQATTRVPDAEVTEQAAETMVTAQASTEPGTADFVKAKM
ncbi:hypothetical protein D9613_000910 [Agrocybe pediades]|uniref:Serine aminopeptidase S33 domain-containing protein n=1 Tax=Agrocybe pediades TaxID=84607 RepID=A0A8H4VUZ9_9AGAR|nr:hypothetical protein D9613_000910 [Agrocybe pediades]